MTGNGLTFLLLSGCVLVCHLHADSFVRNFYHIKMMKNWTEAQQYCRETFTDLATILDADQNTVAQQAATSAPIWIGFFKSDWRWSLDEEELSKENLFAHWGTIDPMLKCAIISQSGQWSTKNCEYKYYALCYNAENNMHILVKKKMTWSDSQAYCRSMYTDLSSIRNQEDNHQISSLLQSLYDSLAGRDSSRDSSQDGGLDGGQDGGQDGGLDGGQDGGQDGSQDSDADSVENRIEINKKDSDDGGDGVTNRNTVVFSIWIGLHRYFWMWSNQNRGSFMRWATEQSDDINANCAKVDSTANWFTALCSEKHFFLCHSDHIPSMVRTVKVRLNGGSADLNDPTLQGSILQQLKQRMEEAGIREEVKLRWNRQPDGKVFHREEEERAPPPGLEEETVCDSLVSKQRIK